MEQAETTGMSLCHAMGLLICAPQQDMTGQVQVQAGQISSAHAVNLQLQYLLPHA